MHVGVPKEVKVAEQRVGLTPASVRELVAHGHEVTVEAGAGIGIGAPDEVYVTAGATIAVDTEAVWREADLVVKVKEPQETERAKLREGQLLFTYLHLAPDVPQTEQLLESGATCIDAIEMAIGLGSQVTVLDRDLDVLDRLSRRFGAELETVYSTNDSLEAEVLAADLVIGAVLVKGATAPKLVTEELVKRMKPGSVLVDVAIDQGGCFETSRPTTHATPTYVLHDVVHYCVANMPGAVPRTSTYALNNATLPFTLALADQGPHDALLADAHFLGGLNICGGMLTEQHVAEAQGLAYVPPAEALAKVYA
ncbi:MAG: alanine dehydrogenase [Actinobacteria bacterium]|nr:alanine dehydrogenase [Actinomycetota bacterium]